MPWHQDFKVQRFHLHSSCPLQAMDRFMEVGKWFLRTMKKEKPYLGNRSKFIDAVRLGYPFKIG